jgi:5'-nucleotidase
MNILVANDDGIDALGIHKLAEALSDVGDVYVCAPNRQQSASGHGITIGRVVCIEEVPFTEAKGAISMEGTPADCVKIGLEIYRERGIEMDMVFSGFNHGMNLGTDTLYSGTVAAAVEGALCGLPAAAMSIATMFTNHRSPDQFETAMKMARFIARSELSSSSKRAGSDSRAFDIDFIRHPHVIFNVNIPNLPPDEIKGVKICRLSYGAYHEWFQERVNEEGRVGYHYSGIPMVIGEAEAEDSDIIANREGYVTVTPLQFDLTNRDMLDGLREKWTDVII